MATPKKKSPQCPEISDALIEYLEYRFSDSISSLQEVSEKTILGRLGERRVVDHLKSEQKRQIKKGSENIVST